MSHASDAMVANRPSVDARSRVVRGIVLFSIQFYQHTLSRLLPPACRFWPSCSRYSSEAIARYGVRRGGWMTVCRLARCHPFNAGGYDPVR